MDIKTLIQDENQSEHFTTEIYIQCDELNKQMKIISDVQKLVSKKIPN